jgi:hypothetical protein
MRVYRIEYHQYEYNLTERGGDWHLTPVRVKYVMASEKCADGIQALRHYRYEIEEAKSDPAGGHIALSKVPRHDWASHGADAFRTAAVMIREPEKKKEREKRRPAGKLSPWS